MKLEQQVCSLDLAKRLKELGVKQESLFYYSRTKASQKHRLGDFIGVYQPWESSDDDHAISAFTVAELGGMLPFRKEENGIIVYVTSHKNMDGWGWTVKAMRHDVRNPKKENEHFAIEQADTEADARAKMLIYLLEHKLITL